MNSCPKDLPMTLILTKYQLQINHTIHQIVIWCIWEDCGKRMICFKCIPPYLTYETSTQSRFTRTSSMLIWPIHNFLIVSLMGLSFGQFCATLQQNGAAWKGEQNQWGPAGFTPTCKDQNNVDHFFDKRCDALRICAWWKNSKQWILCKDWIRFKEKLQFWEKGCWFLLQESAPALAAMIMKQPNLMPDNFIFTIPQVKTALKWRLQNGKRIRNNMINELNAVHRDSLLTCNF